MRENADVLRALRLLWDRADKWANGRPRSEATNKQAYLLVESALGQKRCGSCGRAIDNPDRRCEDEDLCKPCADELVREERR